MPTVVNPVEDFVDKHYESGGVTGLGRDSDTAYQSVHKTILGLYKKVPPRIAAYMAKVLSEESGGEKSEIELIAEIQRDYHEWANLGIKQLIENIRCGKLEAEAFFVPAYQLKKQYPTFKAWRESLSYSQIDFCKTFLIHQAILQKYEAGEMQKLPASLEQRIEQILSALFDYPEKYSEGGKVLRSEGVRAYLFALRKLPIS